MSIWAYRELGKEDDLLQSRGTCAFCSEHLRDLFSGKEEQEPGNRFRYVVETHLSTCPRCGWWQIKENHLDSPIGGRKFHTVSRAASGSLKRMDLTDISLPLEEVKAYLRARYEARHLVHPRLFEETVASAFKSLGFLPKVTAYSSDGGIDIILYKDTEEVGVQVKRYRHAITVEQIRAFLGALVLGGHTKGIFVTTSRFTRVAEAAVEECKIFGHPIELIDAERFYQILGIEKRPHYHSLRDLLDACELRSLEELRRRMTMLSQFEGYD